MNILDELATQLSSGALIVGDSELARYVVDWPGTTKGKALGLVRPTSTREVAAVMRLASAHRVPVVPQGGNTGVVGGGIPDNSGKALLLTLERMNAIRDISAPAMTLTAEAGCVLQHLHEAVEAQGLYFPLSLGAKGSCTLGGNLATNAGGTNVLRYGNAKDLCLGIEAVLPDGRVLDLLSGLRKNNTGYDLMHLLIGSEGTLGVITGATVKLWPRPNAHATALLAIDSIADALALLNRIQAATGGALEAFELMPRTYMELAASFYQGWRPSFDPLPPFTVLVDLAALSAADGETGKDGSVPVENRLQSLLSDASDAGIVRDAIFAKSASQRNEMWALREAALEVIGRAGFRINFDISLPLDKLQVFAIKAHELAERHVAGIRTNPLGHLGDGNLHFAIFAPPGGEEKLKRHAKEIKDAVLELLCSMGGSFSAEHGIGVKKLQEMRRFKDPVALEVMRQIKQALDPANIMNPGKVIPQ